MFLLDDLVLAPCRGILALARAIDDAVGEEFEGAVDRIVAELRSLYLLLESGQLTQADFEAQESLLLGRLDELEREREAGAGSEHEQEGGAT